MKRLKVPKRYVESWDKLVFSLHTPTPTVSNWCPRQSMNQWNRFHLVDYLYIKQSESIEWMWNGPVEFTNKGQWTKTLLRREMDVNSSFFCETLLFFSKIYFCSIGIVHLILYSNIYRDGLRDSDEHLFVYCFYFWNSTVFMINRAKPL